MSKSRNLHIFGLLCNLAIIVFGIIGICTAEANFVKSLKYFTFITALVSCLVSAIASIFHIKSIKDNKDSCPKFIYTLRFIAATMALITFIVVVTYLLPSAKDEATRARLITGDGLFLHILLPAVSVGCFILFEIEPEFRFRNCFAPLVVTLIYGVAIIICIVVIYFTQGVVAADSFAPYLFFRIFPDMSGFDYFNYAMLGIVFVGAFVLSFVLWLLNRIVSSIIVGYEVPVAKSASNKAVDSKKTSKASQPIGIATKFDSSRVYHISVYDHKIKNWKVKLATSSRAIKVFKTQKEAIDFATAIVNKSGGSIRVHSRLGRIRKN